MPAQEALRAVQEVQNLVYQSQNGVTVRDARRSDQTNRRNEFCPCVRSGDLSKNDIGS